MMGSRLTVFVGAVLVCTAAVLARAVQVGLVQHDHWVKAAGSQQGTEQVYTTPRGQIRSSDGALLATSVRRWAVQVDTRRVEHPDLFAAAVGPLLGRDPAALAERLSDGPRYVWLAKNLTRETADAVRDLARRAVVRVPMWQRLYPQGKTAAPLLGFARYQELQLEGATGLELYYEDSLAGDPERWLVVSDAHGRPLRPARQVHPGRPGSDLDLTIDTRIQRAAERELEGALDRYGAVGGAVVVLEAHTGNLLALASAPLTDRPDTGVPYDGECWALRPVQRAWEPGSTVKPFVAAAGLAFGVVNEREVFDCRAGGIRVAGHWIRDHAERDRYTLDGVIAQSSNTGIIRVAERIPEEDLWTVLDALGFGRSSGLGLGAESRGILRPVHRWSGMSRASLALGQELITTPLQLAMAYGVVANGGWLLEPRLVERMGGPTPTTDRSAVRVRVMDDALARRTAAMLELVIADGTGEEAAVAGLRVAGKTGTAQRAVVGGFDDEHHVAWFAGFLPMPDPRWVVVVAVEEPEEDFWASSVAAPVFRGVAAEIAALWGVERPPVVRRET